MRITSPELHDKKVRAGRKGGNTTFTRYGREQMAAWAKTGGRPRNPTIEELMSRQAELKQKEKEKRREQLPAGNSLEALLARLQIQEAG